MMVSRVNDAMLSRVYHITPIYVIICDIILQLHLSLILYFAINVYCIQMQLQPLYSGWWFGR